MKLVAISEEGTPAEAIGELPEIAKQVMASCAAMAGEKEYVLPWVGYLAVEGGVCVGTCAFKSAPVDGRVEIAYFTFPGVEGRGVATRMGRGLLRVAGEEVRIFAQTLPEEGASTRVLEKLGFRKAGEVEHPEDGLVWEWERGDDFEG
ncbi:MAG: GNAT family N-acetyltransferase [Verrucomicrobiaceae bacterium]